MNHLSASFLLNNDEDELKDDDQFWQIINKKKLIFEVQNYESKKNNKKLYAPFGSLDDLIGF